ncbi:MAG TPA: acyltransferase [Stellaceae bacterium]|nr:acyltransferase [Stellaceae bacterium]
MPPPLSRETSLYLDAVRFVAALTVFLGHFATRDLSGGLFWQVAPFRHDAVIVFFVLSGFVISHAAAKSEPDARTYIINRAARLYSVVVPAIALTLLCDAIGGRLAPNYFAWSYSPGPLWQQLATSLTFTNQFWNAAFFPGSDGPYWSLGYEVPYYAIFGCALFARGAWRFVLPALLLAVAGPTVAALFPLWLIGAAVQRFGHRVRLTERGGWMLFLGSIVLWSAIQHWALGTNAWIFHDPIPFLTRDRIPADYVTGLCFAVNILGFAAIAHRFVAPLGRGARAIRWAAGSTFTLYLVHYPVMKLCVALAPAGVSAASTRVLCLSATLLAVVVAARLFERHKGAWRRLIAALVPARGAGPLIAAPRGT